MHGCGLLPQSWSPDSTRLVCEKSSGDGLAITDAADGTATSLTGRGWEPRWSPDGRTVAFVDRVVDPGLWSRPPAERRDA